MYNVSIIIVINNLSEMKISFAKLTISTSIFFLSVLKIVLYFIKLILSRVIYPKYIIFSCECYFYIMAVQNIEALSASFSRRFHTRRFFYQTG